MVLGWLLLGSTVALANGSIAEQIPWNNWNNPKSDYQDCGQSCLYQKANENISLQSVYILHKIKMVQDTNISEATRRDNLRGFCVDYDNKKLNVQKESNDECFKRYVFIQEQILYKMRKAMLENSEQISKLANGRMVNGKWEPHPVLVPHTLKNDPMKIPQIPNLPKWEELEKQANLLRGSSTEEYGEWMKDLLLEPKDEDFVDYEIVQKDPTDQRAGTVMVAKKGPGACGTECKKRKDLAKKRYDRYLAGVAPTGSSSAATAAGGSQPQGQTAPTSPSGQSPGQGQTAQQAKNDLNVKMGKEIVRRRLEALAQPVPENKPFYTDDWAQMKSEKPDSESINAYKRARELFVQPANAMITKQGSTTFGGNPGVISNSYGPKQAPGTAAPGAQQPPGQQGQPNGAQAKQTKNTDVTIKVDNKGNVIQTDVRRPDRVPANQNTTLTVHADPNEIIDTINGLDP